VYRVDAMIAGRWMSVLSGIVVSRGRAHHRDQPLGTEPPAQAAAIDEIEEEDADHEDEDDNPEPVDDHGSCDC
jgi:hypothetical protein